MVGNKYGDLTVIKMIYNPTRKQFSNCECICTCGNTVIKDAYKLRHNPTDLSCGCLKTQYERKSKTKCMLNKKYGRLTIIEEIWNDGNKRHKVRCKCDCGNEVILNRYDVMELHTQSCGCLQKEMASKAQQVDDTGYISDYNVEIISPHKRNDKNQLLWLCKCSCGNTFYDLPARIKNNHVRSCGCLIESSNESFISSFLKTNNIRFIQQYTYDDCKSRNNYKLRFDFALLNDKDEVFYLIEYDGKQHFEPIEHFGGEESYKLTVERDTIKNNYCKSNDIPLLRLPYYLSNKEIIKEITNIMNP